MVLSVTRCRAYTERHAETAISTAKCTESVPWRLRLWNDAELQRAEREREERKMLELVRRSLEWDGRGEDLPP